MRRSRTWSTHAHTHTHTHVDLRIYDAALTNLELDRLGNYLARKFALPYLRLDNAVPKP